MGREQFLKQVRLVRRDLGDLLFHFTRDALNPDPLDRRVTAKAFDILRKILRESQLRGDFGYIKGTTRCVCFTEAPLSELVNLFQIAPPELRYKPYGVAVRRTWLFKRGGRPAIYQPEREYKLLDQSIQWRHSTFEPPRLDFSWEREWRIAIDRLPLEPANTLVVVPTSDELQLLAKEFNNSPQQPAWSFVSLELLGLGREVPAT